MMSFCGRMLLGPLEGHPIAGGPPSLADLAVEFYHVSTYGR
jgi:hypothetical protein